MGLIDAVIDWISADWRRCTIVSIGALIDATNCVLLGGWDWVIPAYVAAYSAALIRRAP